MQTARSKKPAYGLWCLVLATTGAMVLAGRVDYTWTVLLHENAWPWLHRFMGRSVFEAEGVGGGDLVAFFMIAVVGGYYIAWKGYGNRRLVKWRPQLGFMITSALVCGVNFVHGLKWILGRARPKLVIRQDWPFTDWYEIGPHFITEGIYRGSFPSGHTVQAFLLMTLAYVLAGDKRHGLRLRLTGWLCGLIATGFTVLMGIGRCMSLSHWLSDVVGGLCGAWLIMHLLYFHILKVPAQAHAMTKAAPPAETPPVWELQLCVLLFALTLSLVALAFGLRGLSLRAGLQWAALIAIGLAGAMASWRATQKLYAKVFKLQQQE